MKTQVKNIFRDLTPPLLWRTASRLLYPPVSPATPARIATELPPKQYGATGDYASYDEAQRACGDSYHNALLQEKTRALTEAIRADALISQLNIRLLAAIQYAALHTSGDLDVVDFGGAMGAHYFYLRHLLPPIAHWTVIEIDETVALGRQHFADGILTFEPDVNRQAPVVLSSGALQYTPDPYAALADLLNQDASFVILDKIPMYERSRHVVQHVHPSVFGADVALPAFLFDDQKTRNCFAPYRIIMEWELPGYAAHLDGEYVELYRGFVLGR